MLLAERKGSFRYQFSARNYHRSAVLVPPSRVAGMQPVARYPV